MEEEIKQLKEELEGARNALTLERAEREKIQNRAEKAEKVVEESNPYNPNLHPEVISIIRQPDGNYKGYGQKFGKVVEVREIGPETVLQKLLTHE